MKQNYRFCRNADDPQPNKYFTKQNDISRTEWRYVGRNAKLIRQTHALTCSLHVESLHTWLAITEGLL